MTRKTWWLVVSGLVVLGMALVACQPTSRRSRWK
jgi:hypothetical protein